MPASTIPCPACGANLRPARSQSEGARLRCPACGVIFSGDVIEAGVASPVPTPSRARPNRSDGDDRPHWPRPRPADDNDAWDDPPLRVRDRRHPGGAALVWAIIGGAVVMLGGGLALGVWAIMTLVRPAAPPPPPVVARVWQNDNGKKPDAPVAPVRVPRRRPRVDAPAPPVNHEATIPAATLRALKSATVFVKVRSGLTEASGSGFLVQSSNGDGFLITNHHVVDPSDAADSGRDNRFPFRRPFAGFPGIPQPPGLGGRLPGFPQLPRPPFGPRVGPFGGSWLRPPTFRIKPDVHVVLYSGTPQHETLAAEVVADDADADLAVLHVHAAHGLPAALDIKQQPPLDETLPVYILGFPFGADLAVGQGDPAITVCRGAVSALRRNDRGDLVLVQITGEIHPGNSGGPVVDAAGRLVGIAVAKIRNTNIGFAIPSSQLTTVLSGRLDSASVVRIKAEKGLQKQLVHTATFDRQNRVRFARHSAAGFSGASPEQLAGQVVVTAQLVDPLQQIRSVTIHEARGTHASQGQPGPDGSWPPLQSDATTRLNRNGQTAKGTLDLDTTGPKGDLYTFQCSYETSAGRTVYTQAWQVHVNETPAIPKAVTRRGPATGPPLSAADLAEALDDLKANDEFRHMKALGRLTFATPTPARRQKVAAAIAAVVRRKARMTLAFSARALALWCTKETLPTLIDLLHERDFGVRISVLTAIGNFKDARLAEAVAGCLKQQTDRSAAGVALRALGSVAESATRSHLKDADWQVRLEACRILGDIGTSASLPALQQTAAHDSLGTVKDAATHAVEQIRQRARQGKEQAGEAKKR